MAEFDLFAVCAPGLQDLLGTELRARGLSVTAVEDGGVSLRGGLDIARRVNVDSALATRVLVRVARFKALALGELTRKAGQVPWELALRAGDAVQVRATCRKSRLYHSGAVVQRVAEGMAARLGGPVAVRKASEDEAGDAAQLVIVRVDHNEVTVSLDTSGELLHRRGWRTDVGEAPLRETLAAALLAHAGWDPTSVLVDPFCGSGTLLIEGARQALGIRPGSGRPFAMDGWPGAARQKRPEEGGLGVPRGIFGSDVEPRAVAAARANARRAGVEVRLDVKDVAEVVLPEGPPGFLATNPPYGVRLGDGETQRALAGFGRLLQRAPGWRVAVVAPGPVVRGLPVRWEREIRTKNGGLDVVLAAGRV